MAIRIKSRGGETAEQMLRRFKKLCEKEGLTKDIKRKEYYEKPSERNRRAVRKAIGRRIREEMGPLALGPKGKRGPGGPERGERGERGDRGPGGPGGGMGY